MTALQVSRVSKSFPGVKALDDVSMTLRGGSVHALLGENGAGKSTLIKIMTGIHRADHGKITMEGTPTRFANPRQAAAGGLGVVHQERNLVTRFSVAENIMLDRLGKHALSSVNYPALAAEARRWLLQLDLDIDPMTPVSRLSVAQMQLVEIGKALSLQSRVLLLDEPTASLTPSEAQVLFRILRKLRDQGVAIGFVSHKLEEVFDICDTVTVLRDGRNACDSASLKSLNRDDVVKMMIGRAERISRRAPRPQPAATPYFELRDYSSAAGHHKVSLSVRPGEILGLYGLVGAGRSELAKAVLGLARKTGGEILVSGEPRKIGSVAEALDLGIGYVSEDRKGEGLILLHSVLANAGITVWRTLASAVGFLRDGTVATKVGPILRKLEVKTPSLDQTIGNLSGGNQQKVSVAKWIAAGVKLLIIDEPSVGIDIKTKAYLHDLIHELAEGGTAVLLITSDLTEMVDVADRVAVMVDGRIEGLVENDRNYERVSTAIMGLIHGRATAASARAG
ncbi:sugar ABC transporter ATP-binding protein [Aestuariivirga sp.]|uniref:sugar ABC transporter ATP-binding protein n=1 Tax=Aestuariivirga sp. TaxID=2650926 RepID=UPI003BAB87FF